MILYTEDVPYKVTMLVDDVIFVDTLKSEAVYVEGTVEVTLCGEVIIIFPRLQ